MTWRIIEGDCVEAMRAMEACSVDAVVCDPPYGLGFMGKDWDSPGGIGDFPMRRSTEANTVNTGASRQGGRQRSCEDFTRRQARDARSYQGWCEEWAIEALRVLKPGGHMLACGGTRTYHRLTAGIEDAGFEIRDCLVWLYGSGFPKSLDVSKAIDAAAGAEREQTGREPRLVTPRAMAPGGAVRAVDPGARFDAPVTPEAERWQGWGTALKPGHEPIVMARKSPVGPVAANVLAHGTGALNVDGCRIGMSDKDADFIRKTARPNSAGQGHEGAVMNRPGTPTVNVHTAGRWPANVALNPEAAAMLDEQTGERRSAGEYVKGAREQGDKTGAASIPIDGLTSTTYADFGGASRFFYCAKADTAERNIGLHGERNQHPTVKPMTLMRWLVRLVTPPGGLVLDPFAGSGTTGIAALREGFSFVGIERETEYVAIARQRIIGDAPLLNSASEDVA